MSRIFIVYILRCTDGSYYTGMTSTLEQRLQEHQEGKYPNCYTYKRRPVQLVWSQEFDNTHDATTWERRIHEWSRKKKEALIKGDWGLIQECAKRKTPYVTLRSPPVAVAKAGISKRRPTREEAPAEALRDGPASS